MSACPTAGFYTLDSSAHCSHSCREFAGLDGVALVLHSVDYKVGVGQVVSGRILENEEGQLNSAPVVHPAP